FYHCVSRVVDRQFIFQTAGHGSPEAERFVLLMRPLEAFSGVRVLTYSLMANHFHLLCEVPQAQRSLCPMVGHSVRFLPNKYLRLPPNSKPCIRDAHPNLVLFHFSSHPTCPSRFYSNHLFGSVRILTRHVKNSGIHRRRPVREV